MYGQGLEPRPPRLRPGPGRLPSGRGWGALGLAALGVVGLGFAHAAGEPPPAPAPTVVVRPGETLWDIALRRYPSDDPRERVDEIERMNRLPGPLIQPGQRLALPPP